MPPPQPRKGGKEAGVGELLSCVRGGGGDRLENLAVKKLGVAGVVRERGCSTTVH